MAIENPFIFGDIYMTKEEGILFESTNKMVLVPSSCVMITVEPKNLLKNLKHLFELVST